jgi:hypothetical protein
MCFIRVGVTHKHYTRLAILARDIQYSLPRTFLNYDRKKINNVGPRAQCYETSFVLNL